MALVLAALGCGLLPGEALARHRMSFTPGDRARPAPQAVHRDGTARRTGGRHIASARRRQPGQAVPDRGDAGVAVAKPGGGFSLDHGVLTYPAPARFQPRALLRRP